MRAAIEAARAVRGRTSPNPWVGAALVRHGRLVSVGATSPYGGPHAEAAALAGVDARGAELYVTLEPCVMCAGALVNSRIGRVVYGATDPKAGAVTSLYEVCADERLNHRPPVAAGVLADECGRLLKDFFAARRG